MKLSKALLQLYDLQDLLMAAAKSPDCTRSDLSRLACAWERLEERKRILRRVPLPGAYRPELPKRKSKPRSRPIPVEVLEPDSTSGGDTAEPEPPWPG